MIPGTYCSGLSYFKPRERGSLTSTPEQVEGLDLTRIRTWANLSHNGFADSPLPGEYFEEGRMGDLTEHFDKDEFRCKCGCNEVIVHDTLLYALEMMRDRVRQPIIINSAYRCKEHNDEVGGCS